MWLFWSQYSLTCIMQIYNNDHWNVQWTMLEYVLLILYCDIGNTQSHTYNPNVRLVPLTMDTCLLVGLYKLKGPGLINVIQIINVNTLGLASLSTFSLKSSTSRSCQGNFNRVGVVLQSTWVNRMAEVIWTITEKLKIIRIWRL